MALSLFLQNSDSVCELVISNDYPEFSQDISVNRMKITGTQFSIEKKTSDLELRLRGQIVDRFPFQGKTLIEVVDEIWVSMKRKGVTIQKSILKDDLTKLFPGIRITGPLK